MATRTDRPLKVIFAALVLSLFIIALVSWPGLTGAASGSSPLAQPAAAAAIEHGSGVDVPLDFIELNRSPSPPNCVNPGGSESFNWTITFSSIPDHYVYSITNPLNNVVYGPFTVNIQGHPSPVTGSDVWPVPSNAMPGNYAISIFYYSNFGLEATARVIFIVCTPAATSTPTSTPTNTSTPPQCTPVVIVTPAYTPGPGCTTAPPPGVLSAVITDHPTTTEARFTNTSTTCSYRVGLATYRRFDNSLENQQLYDYALAIIPPNSTLTLTVNNPTCSFAAYAFYGDILPNFVNNNGYQERTLDTTAGNDGVQCTNPCESIVPTRTPTATATNTPTPQCTPVVIVTPAYTPGPGCSTTPPPGVLSAVITDHPTTTEAVFTNHSSTCSYRIGLAIYRRFDNSLENQQLYDYALAVIPPNATLTLTVNNPTCSYAAYAFYGDILPDFVNNGGYGSRALDTTTGNDGIQCTNPCNPIVPTRTATPARSATPTRTPCDVCSLYWKTANVSCNPDYTTHWSGTVRNNATCTVYRAYRVDLQTRYGYDGPWVTVSQQMGTALFAPGLTNLSGNFCYEFRQTDTFMRVYVTMISPLDKCQVDYISSFKDVCRSNPSCSISPAFKDVSSSDSFSTAVNALASIGAISGYADGTFRPEAPVSRGQLARMVAIAFSLVTPGLQSSQAASLPKAQRFADVPATHPFYTYIEAAAAEGLMAGYADGTFHPNSSVTRGQAVHVLVRAAGWLPVSTSTKPTFVDVPVGSSLLGYLEAAYAHGIVQGYADGTFHPNERATRAQLARMLIRAASPQEAKHPNAPEDTNN